MTIQCVCCNHKVLKCGRRGREISVKEDAGEADFLSQSSSWRWKECKPENTGNAGILQEKPGEQILPRAPPQRETALLVP